MKAAISKFAKDQGLRSTEWFIFECSGSAAGQLSAYGLLVHGATLCVVGFTMDKVEVRLSNLMAFDARAIGNWGCPPEYYPAALDLVLDGHSGRLVCLRNGHYNHVSIDAVVGQKKVVDVARYYNVDRLRPLYRETFLGQPMLAMTS